MWSGRVVEPLAAVEHGKSGIVSGGRSTSDNAAMACTIVDTQMGGSRTRREFSAADDANDVSSG